MPQDLPNIMSGWERPVRIPDSIEITHTFPAFAIADKIGIWRIPFKLSKDVRAKSVLKLQLWGGRNNKGAFPGAQVENPEAEGFIAAEFEDGMRIPMKAGTASGTYDIILSDRGLKKGQYLSVLLGGNEKGGAGITPANSRLLNKFFVLYDSPIKEAGIPDWALIRSVPVKPVKEPKLPDVWTKATEDLILAVCTMHILGGKIDHIRAYAPSTSRPGESFHILVRPEDKFGNLSCREMRDIVVSVNGKTLEPEIEKVTGSTCVRLKIALCAEGTYRINVRDAASNCETTTNPVICLADAQPVYWGMIHGHTEMSDGLGSMNYYFNQLKNEVLLDFAASADHDHRWETSDEYWKMICEAVKHWHSPNEFVVLLGYEWAKWRQNGDGDRNVYYLNDDQPMYRSDDGECPSPPDLFNALSQNKAKAIIIPHHTGHGGNFCDWKDHSIEYERLVEIFQVRGSYECSEEDGNPVPEKDDRCLPNPTGYVQNALTMGWRVGFTAGGDDHSGQWGTEFLFPSGKTYYKQGLMSVESSEKTREAIFEAMYNRRVVATTGARMLLTYRLNGNPMGAELSLKIFPELAVHRTITIEFHGTAGVDRADIIRNNKVVHSVSGNGVEDLFICWEDREQIDNIWLPPAKFCANCFAFYYVRVVQQDREAAWASPVWIDR